MHPPFLISYCKCDASPFSSMAYCKIDTSPFSRWLIAKCDMKKKNMDLISFPDG